MTNITGENQLAERIEHTLLTATATEEQIRQLCEDAKTYGFHCVCVNPRWVGFAADQLHGSKIKACTVISFPLGADSTKSKVAAVHDAIMTGADEIDMVADLAAVMQGDSKYLTGQLHAVLKLCRSMRPAVPLKLIIESAALDTNQKMFICQIAENCGVDFIKTSTGTHLVGGATIEDIKLIRQIAPNCKIKASGGIKTAKQALEMLDAGAERIGTSHGVEIINQFRAGQI